MLLDELVHPNFMYDDTFASVSFVIEQILSICLWRSINYFKVISATIFYRLQLT